MRPEPFQRGGAGARCFPASAGWVCAPEVQLHKKRERKIRPRRCGVSFRRLSLMTAVIVLGAAAYRARPTNADEWLPISPEELKMTGDPAAPGAPAIILYRQVNRDDSNSHVPHEYDYVREKIFTEEGRKYADVEIPFVKGDYEIVNIRARDRKSVV